MDDWWGHFWSAVQALGAIAALGISIGLFQVQGWAANKRLEKRIHLLARTGRDMMDDMLNGSDDAIAFWMSARKPVMWRDLVARLDAIPMESIEQDKVQQAVLSLAVIFRDAEWLHAEVGLLDNKINALEKMRELHNQVEAILRNHF